MYHDGTFEKHTSTCSVSASLAHVDPCIHVNVNCTLQFNTLQMSPKASATDTNPHQRVGRHVSVRGVHEVASQTVGKSYICIGEQKQNLHSRQRYITLNDSCDKKSIKKSKSILCANVSSWATGDQLEVQGVPRITCKCGRFYHLIRMARSLESQYNLVYEAFNLGGT